MLNAAAKRYIDFAIKVSVENPDTKYPGGGRISTS